MNNAKEVNDGLSLAGLPPLVEADQYGLLNDFIAMRKHWNQTHNLSGPKALLQPWQLDVSDAVALARLTEVGLPIFDVGSGSGVPGLILKILQPTLEIHLIEPIAKRVAFLKTAIHQLSLNKIIVHRTKWPMTLTRPSQVVSRAVISPQRWPRFAAVPHAQIIYRYLAAERPSFSIKGFIQTGSVDYRRNTQENMRLEKWAKITPMPDAV